MWSYSGNPASSPLDEVRFLIGDTVAGVTPTLSNEEIDYNIALVYGSVGAAPASGNFLPAAYCADFLQTKFAAFADSKGVGPLHLAFANRAQRFAMVARNLRNRATFAGVAVYAGGQTWSDKNADDQDRDRVQPAVKVDQFDYLGPTNDTNDGSFGP